MTILSSCYKSFRVVISSFVLACAFCFGAEFTFAANSSTTTSYFNLRSEHCKKHVPTCNRKLKSTSSSTHLSDLNIIAACERFYKDNNCDAVKDSVGQERSAAIMSCSSEEICKDEADLNILQCTIDGVKMQFQIPALIANVGISAGLSLAGASTLTSTLIFMPFLIYGTGEQEKLCNADKNYKTMAIKMHNLALAEGEKPLSPEGTNANLLKMPCSDLNNFLRRRLDVFVEKRQEEMRWSTTAKSRAPSPAAKALLESLKSNRCFTKRILQEEACRTLASFAVGSVVGSVGTMAGKSSKKFLEDRLIVAPKLQLIPVVGDSLKVHEGRMGMEVSMTFTQGKSKDPFHQASAKAYLYDFAYKRNGRTHSFEVAIPSLKPGKPDLKTLKRIEKIVSQLPTDALKDVKKLIINPFSNKDDSFWEKEYKISDFRSSASAGKSEINIYTCVKCQLPSKVLQTMEHELGHIVASRHYGSTTPDASWAAAIKSDGQQVSNYGSKAHSEDFAEAMRVYLSTDGGIKNPELLRRFAGRFQILDQIMGVDANARQQIIQQLRSQMARRNVYWTAASTAGSSQLTSFRVENKMTVEMEEAP